MHRVATRCYFLGGTTGRIARRIVEAGGSERTPPHGVIWADGVGVVRARVGEVTASFPPEVFSDPERVAREWCRSMGAETVEEI